MCWSFCARLFQLSVLAVARQNVCARLFQLSLDKAERECVDCFQQDCLSSLPTKMNVNVVVLLCETVSIRLNASVLVLY